MKVSQLKMKLSLPNITLAAVTSVDIEKTHNALLYSAQAIEFGAIKFFSSIPPISKDCRVNYVPIPPIDLLGYNRFIIQSLHEQVATTHCLIVQADGFVLNPELWTPSFADYDYIGAPWPEFVIKMPADEIFYLDRNRVGNGGFSLRSKRLLELTSLMNIDPLTYGIPSEDIVICHYLFDELKAAGVRYAPIDEAAKFSIDLSDKNFGDAASPLNRTFGFHGKHWLGDLVDRFICERITRQVTSQLEQA
jgi:hypothetical protein